MVKSDEELNRMVEGVLIEGEVKSRVRIDGKWDSTSWKNGDRVQIEWKMGQHQLEKW